MFKFYGVVLGLAFLVFSCATETPVTEAVVPLRPLVDDDHKLVAAKDFLTEFPDWKTPGSLISFTPLESGITLKFSGSEEVAINFLTPETFRFRYIPEGTPPSSSYAVIKSDYAKVPVTTEDTPDELSLQTAVLKIVISRSTGAFTITRQGKTLATFLRPLARTTEKSNRIVSTMSLGEEDKIYGFGEKTGTLDRRGKSMKMWNSDTYRYKTETDPIYASIPFFVNAKPGASWGLFFDNTYQSYFDVGATNPEELYFGALKGEMDFYFFGGGNLKSVVKNYTELTGRISLPPKWALGFQQSRYSYTTAEEVMATATTFREKKMPVDVIYLDIDFMDSFRSFTHHSINFPDPKKLMDDLEALNFKVVTIIDPGIARKPGYEVFDTGDLRDVFVRNDKGTYMTGTVWPGNCVFPDFTKPDTRAWWGDQYKILLDWGIDGIWNDMNEPSVFNTKNKTLPWDSVHWDFGLKSLHAKVHNVYGLEMLKATSEGLQNLRPGLRNFVLGRAGYAGVQRYTATWTGDNTADWDHLKMNITMVLGLGLSGQPYSGADVGGYSDSPSPELMARWMNLGALMPFYRNHTEKGTLPQEPWAFGLETEKSSQAALKLRYTLMPLLYDQFLEAAQTGAPILRPLFYEFPDDPESFKVEDEFLLGRDLLAAPVVAPGVTSREVYLPSGTSWFDYHTGEEFRGGKSYEISAPWDKIPLFVRGGGIIPTQEPEQWMGEKVRNPITLQIYPGAAGKHLLWQDDETTLGYKTGIGRGTQFQFAASGRELTITQTTETASPGYTPPLGYYFLRLHNVYRPAKVMLDRVELPLYGDSYGVTEADRSTAWYENDKTLLIKVFNWNVDQVVKITY